MCYTNFMSKFRFSLKIICKECLMMKMNAFFWRFYQPFYACFPMSFFDLRLKCRTKSSLPFNIPDPLSYIYISHIYSLFIIHFDLSNDHNLFNYKPITSATDRNIEEKKSASPRLIEVLSCVLCILYPRLPPDRSETL